MLQGVPSTVTQNTGNAGYYPSPITLDSHASCTLQLDITGEAISNFTICFGSSCSTAAVPLNVTQSSALHDVTVGSYFNG